MRPYLCLVLVCVLQAFGQNVMDTLFTTPELSELAQAIQREDLATVLTGPSVTIFAPTNAAVSNLTREMLTHLILQEVVPSDDFSNDVLYPTLNGDKLRINVYGEVATVDGARISRADITATNGVIHVITGVPVPPRRNIMEYLESVPELSSFTMAMKQAGVPPKMKSLKGYTVFAPTNEAIRVFDNDIIDRLVDNKVKHVNLLETIVNTHIVEGAVFTPGLQDGETVVMLSGSRIKVSITGVTIRVDDARITEGDKVQMDGVVHMIDAVIVPPMNLLEEMVFRNLTTYASAAVEVGFNTTLVNPSTKMTLFVPINEAFAELAREGSSVLQSIFGNLTHMERVVRYHAVDDIVPYRNLAADMELESLVGKLRIEEFPDVSGINGSGVLAVNGRRILHADIETTNGVVHVIDGVLFPPRGSLLASILADRSLRIFGTIIQVTSVRMAIADPSAEYTIFAPTDEAFRKVGVEGAESLIGHMSTQELVDLINSHIVKKKLYTLSMVDGDWTSESGELIKIEVEDSDIRVNNVTIARRDVMEVNGVIHYMDSLLVSYEAPPKPTGSSKNAAAVLLPSLGLFAWLLSFLL